MLVVGGYNSSNTCHLAALVHSAACPVPYRGRRRIDPEAGTLRHQPVGTKREEIDEPRWLGGARIIGITAGASTPNNKIGETIARIAEPPGKSWEP